MDPDLTAIIVSHDTRDDLVACLEALPAAAGGLDLQVVVFDNASSDGSAEAVEGTFPGVELVTAASNLGFGRACNLAAARARAPFLAVLNADVACAPGSLERLVAFLVERPDAAVVGPRLTNPDGSLQTSAYRFPGLVRECASVLGLRRWLPAARLRGSPLARRLLPGTGHLDPHEETRPVDFVTGACVVVRRDDLESVGGFDERFFLYYEEIDLCRRLRAAGREVFHLPEARVVHRLNRSAARRPGLAFLARQQSRLLFHGKHEGPAFVLVLRAVLGTRAALGFLRRRLPPVAARADGIEAGHWLRVLRWCLRPGSIPRGRPVEGPGRARARRAHEPAGQSQSRGGSMSAGE